MSRCRPQVARRVGEYQDRAPAREDTDPACGPGGVWRRAQRGRKKPGPRRLRPADAGAAFCQETARPRQEAHTRGAGNLTGQVASPAGPEVRSDQLDAGPGVGRPSAGTAGWRGRVGPPSHGQHQRHGQKRSDGRGHRWPKGRRPPSRGRLKPPRLRASAVGGRDRRSCTRLRPAYPQEQPLRGRHPNCAADRFSRSASGHPWPRPPTHGNPRSSKFHLKVRAEIRRQRYSTDPIAAGRRRHDGMARREAKQRRE